MRPRPRDEAWDRRLRADPEDREAARRRLLDRHRRGDREDVLAPLRDLRSWDASEARQDLAIEEVDRRLGVDFQHIDTAVYECGGARHRIATFYHLWTSIELQLIPGEESLPPFLIGRFPLRCREARHHFFASHRETRVAALPLTPLHLRDLANGLESLGSGFRLPFDDEWNRAAAAGATTRYYWGSEPSLDHVICAENSPGLPADPLERIDKANAFGLVDVLGNVFELTQSRRRPADFESWEWWVSDERSLTLYGGSARDPGASCRLHAGFRPGRDELDDGRLLWGIRLARDIDSGGV